MQFPLPTGQVAMITGASEPQLSETVRRGHVSPPPRVVAGRRLWEPFHIRQAAQHLHLLTEDLEQLLQEEVTRGI